MQTVLQFILVMFVCLLVAATLTVWRTVRSFRRSQTFALWRSRASTTYTTFGRGRMGLNAHSRTGSRGRLASLRLTLVQSLDATTRAMDAARVAGHPMGRFGEIHRELARTGATLDTQLRLAERDPDADTRDRAVSALDPQVQRLVACTATLRGALAETAGSAAVSDLDDVAADLDREVGAVADGRRAYSTFNRRHPTTG